MAIFGESGLYIYTHIYQKIKEKISEELFGKLGLIWSTALQGSVHAGCWEAAPTYLEAHVLLAVGEYGGRRAYGDDEGEEPGGLPVDDGARRQGGEDGSQL